MAAPQTGLTSCQIGGIGYPRTVHGNPRCILYVPEEDLPLSIMVTVVVGGGSVTFTPGPGGISTMNVSGSSGIVSSSISISVHTRVDPDENVTTNVRGR